MKYVLIDVSRGDQFEKEFDNLEEALKQGKLDFAKITPADHCTEFYLLESANPDEEAENHYDGEIIKTWIKDGAVVYTIDYNTGAGNEEVLSLEEAKEKADKGAAYTQKDIDIYDAGHKLVARRTWYGSMTDIELEENPIRFGDSGFYGDWEEM